MPVSLNIMEYHLQILVIQFTIHYILWESLSDTFYNVGGGFCGERLHTYKYSHETRTQTVLFSKPLTLQVPIAVDAWYKLVHTDRLS